MVDKITKHCHCSSSGGDTNRIFCISSHVYFIKCAVILETQ